MSDTSNPPFAPFQPTTPEPPVEQSPAADKTKKKRERKPREKKSKIPPVTPTPLKETAKRTRKPSITKRAPKFDLQTILAATAGLKEADMMAFQKGLNLLLDVNKAGRGRVLAALGKVFA